MTRRCYSCDRTRPAHDFARDRSKGSGMKSICKPCDNAKSRRYYVANRKRKLAKANARAVRLRAERAARA
jgi:hypothetical protein